MLVDSSGKINGKQDFLLELGAELPVQLAPAILDIADASLVVVVTSESTLPVQPPVLLLYTSLALR
ncbi:hypothetical protein A2U01_0072959, partial [Trifolium medium]|nr:hypothetical protein [Trifolium medium]